MVRKVKRKIEMLPVMEFTKSSRPHYHILMKSIDKLSKRKLKHLILNLWDESRYTQVRHLRNDKNPDWF